MLRFRDRRWQLEGGEGDSRGCSGEVVAAGVTLELIVSG
jgi:hypothetical protein